MVVAVCRAKQDNAEGQSLRDRGSRTKLPAGLQQSIKNKRVKNTGVEQRALADVATAHITVCSFLAEHIVGPSHVPARLHGYQPVVMAL
jgi:hypothetical protein